MDFPYMYCNVSLSVANKDSNNDNSAYAIAIAFDWTNGRKAIKVLSGIGSERDYPWKEIAIDFPSFYKDYANLYSLANALGCVVHEISTTEYLNSFVWSGCIQRLKSARINKCSIL